MYLKQFSKKGYLLFLFLITNFCVFLIYSLHLKFFSTLFYGVKCKLSNPQIYQKSINTFIYLTKKKFSDQKKIQIQKVHILKMTIYQDKFSIGEFVLANHCN